MIPKVLFYLVAITLFISCTGGRPLPPFDYTEDARIVVEGVLNDENGNPIRNQLVELKFQRYDLIAINKTFSDTNGKFFISSPSSNYAYFLFFENRKIIGSSNYANLLTPDTTNIELYSGIIGELNNQYYNFQNLILQ